MRRNPRRGAPNAPSLLAVAHAAVLAAVLATGGLARAEIYDVPVLVDTEEDIIDLYNNGDLTEGERDVLIDLLDNKVDLNKADRDDLYELPGVTYSIADTIIEARASRDDWFPSVAALEDVVGLPADVVDQIRPFLYVASRTPPSPPIRGSIRIKVADALNGASSSSTATSSSDGTTDTTPIGDVKDPGPSAYMRLRLDGWDGMVGFGYVGILHERPGELSSIDNGGEPALIAESPHYAYDYIPKAYLFLDTELWGDARGAFIIGSYTAGFGERLVFDTTNKRKPDGWYKDDLVQDATDTRRGDFSPRKGLFGASAQLTEMHFTPDVWTDVTAMFSYWRYDQYQYDYSPNRTYYTAEDAVAGEKDCSKEGRCFTYETFPNVFSEILGGGNITTHFGGRSHLGVTGYWAKTAFLIDGVDIAWTRSATYPIRDAFWTAGADAAWGTGIVDLFAEYARTDNGGNAAVLRAELDLDPVDLELSARYYDELYDNPHGRGQAASDEFNGRRARDEAGGMVRMVAKVMPWWRLQLATDIWNHPTNGRTDMKLNHKDTFDPIRELRLSTWVTYTDKDLTVGGRNEDYAANLESLVKADEERIDQLIAEGLDPDEANASVIADLDPTGKGMKLDWGVQLTAKAIPLTTITAYYKMTWWDVSKYEDQFQTDYSTWLAISVKPLPYLGFQTRVKVANEDLDSVEEDTDGDGVPDKESGDEYVQWYARVDFAILKWVKGYVRYDLKWFFDASPPDANPEHAIRGVVDVKF